MKEKSLLLFTLLAQAAVGAVWTLGALHLWIGRQAGPEAAQGIISPGWLMAALLMLAALAVSFFHLGSPLSAWRALHSFSTSWLSREIILAVLFAGAALLLAIRPPVSLNGIGARQSLFALTAMLGVMLVYAMSFAYRLRTVPAWDTWITTVSFFITALLLGALSVAAMLLALALFGPPRDPLLRGLALWAALLLAVQLALLPRWLANLSGSEAAQASFERITHRHGRTLRLRSLLAFMAIVILSIGLLFGGARSTLIVDFGLWLAIGLAVLSEVFGRVLFYAARVRHGI